MKKKRIGMKTMTSIKSRKHLFLIRQLLADKPRDACLFTLGINLGLRSGDLLKLKWSDFLTPEGSIKKVIEILESKTQKVRRIAVNKKVRQALEPLLATRIASGDSCPYLFPSRKHGPHGEARPMSNVRLKQLVASWTSAVKLPGRYGGTSLRKTFGYHVWKECGSLAVLSQIFGHSSEAMTRKYLGIDGEMQDALYLKVNL